MSITIELNAKQLGESLQMHYLPAKIDGDGTANVEKYFENYTRRENDFLTNSLRGYPLQGEELPVPVGYKALVLQETQKPLDESADRKLRVAGTFERFHYWNYDKVPTKADAYRQALQVLTVAEDLAKPISAEEVQKEIARHKEAKTKSKQSP